ncbi:MAG: hypothetical protein U5L45_18290 [Saprospiraceae bacterium]|nr:hypothetical protein [Saprospiraceae bacterium]
MAKKIKSYLEVELIDMFGLTDLTGNDAHPLMAEWLNIPELNFDVGEMALFENIYQNAKSNIKGWQEEDLKMSLIAPILILGKLQSTKRYYTFFERTIEDTVEGHFLKTKTDFMVAAGSVGIFKKPFFHFQEYKPLKNPTGDSMGQLLEAFLIAQQKNNNGKPMYGCEVIGGTWRFVILKDRTYCVSSPFEATERHELLQIIAILRKFKHILETELLD